VAYETEIAAAATKYNLPVSLVTADVQRESNFDPFAIGDGGAALGLMQVHSAAAQEVGVDWDTLRIAIANGDEANAVALGLQAGCGYLAKMMTLFANDQRLALMAYNQGETVISRADAYASAVLALIPQS
jgi:soluble lytic murein transglycosylase-like protein